MKLLTILIFFISCKKPKYFRTQVSQERFILNHYQYTFNDVLGWHTWYFGKLNIGDTVLLNRNLYKIK